MSAVTTLGQRTTLSSWRGLARNLFLGPGPTLHELAHVFVAVHYAEVSLDPGLIRSRVRIDWGQNVPVWGVVASRRRENPARD